MPNGAPAKSHQKSPQQRVTTSVVLVPQQQQQQPQPLPGNYALGHHHLHHHHQVLSAQSSNTHNPSQQPQQHHPHYYHHHNIIQPAATTASASYPNTRRRESANSSIGATSVRRLLTVNRGCRHKIPVHVRAAVIKNFIFLVIGHGLISATLLPLIGLQVSEEESLNQTRHPPFAIQQNKAHFLLSPPPPPSIAGFQFNLVRSAPVLQCVAIDCRRCTSHGGGWQQQQQQHHSLSHK